MEEIFGELLVICISNEILSLRQACELLGANYDKIIEYCFTDFEMSQRLVLCASVIRGNVLEKFYHGELSKNASDALIEEADDLIKIYSTIPSPMEEKGNQ